MQYVYLSISFSLGLTIGSILTTWMNIRTKKMNTSQIIGKLAEAEILISRVRQALSGRGANEKENT